MIIQPPYIIRNFFKDFIWRFSSEEKTLYLTFDDGPEPSVTPVILDFLKAHGALATFFCVGENVKKYPEIYQRILAEGHSVGNHTYNHLNGWKTTNDSYLQNIASCEGLVKTNLFRPPYGKLKSSQTREIKKKYKIIMWDVLSRDYSIQATPQQCLKNVLKYGRNGSIILMHDSIKAEKKVIYSLPIILQHFGEKGYVFKEIKMDQTGKETINFVPSPSLL
jgi:peptidoglycan-N-acetylglucosamine deacetylase